MIILSKSLKTKIIARPDALLDLIVTFDSEAKLAPEVLESHGFKVKRILELTHSLAVHGPAAGVLELIDQPGINSVEEDRRVRALRPPRHSRAE